MHQLNETATKANAPHSPSGSIFKFVVVEFESESNKQGSFVDDKLGMFLSESVCLEKLPKSRRSEDSKAV